MLEAFEANPIEATAQHYAACLSGNAKAIQTIHAILGLSLKQAQSLRIGFSDRSLGSQLPSNQVRHGKEIRTKLETLGIYKANGREALRGYVTIPLLNEQGAVAGIHALRVDAKHYNHEPILIGTGSLPQVLLNQPTSLANQPTSLADQPTAIVDQPTAIANQPTAIDAVVTPELPAQFDNASPEAAPTATPVIATPVITAPSFELIITPHQVTFIRGDRHYKVQGLDRNMSSLTLRVSLQASRQDLVHLDTLDLVKARSRSSFIRAAATELYLEEDTVKKDIGMLLLQLEDLRNRQIEASKSQQSTIPTLSETEQEQALEWLRDPNLCDRIVSDLEQCGMVGEAFNKLAAYLAVVSRKLAQPLAILIQSSSSAGKTTLMDSILAMLPRRPTPSEQSHRPIALLSR